METVKHLNVQHNGVKVGILATAPSRVIAFEYDKVWLEHGFSLNPFSLPLEKKVFLPKVDPFEGLFGVFSDSLPDGWGRLLVDRLMLNHQLNPRMVGNLERLAIVGHTGMGSLSYEPERKLLPDSTSLLDLDKLAMECASILSTSEDVNSNLDELFLLGASSGGARPKILTNIDGEDWIIKFPAQFDGITIGKQEYDYAICAKACGIEMADVKLFSSKNCEGYFGTKRFDRDAEGDKKIHMASVSALLETSHRIPNLDYDILMKLTMQLTKCHQEVIKMYRLMCFNVFAHNRDDHSKNFSYLFDETEKRWKLSPAYDLTHSYSIGGEHATMINGNGLNPTMADLLEIGKRAGINKRLTQKIATEVQDCVESHLSRYLRKK